ncbi:MAG: type IX secretion system sortase PorU, partial [Bacteroidota bacterium]
YALLFGDGHYDFRGIEDSAEDPLGPNHVLPYETERTILQEASYTSDDYFGLLDDNEGVWAWPGINGIRPFQGVVEAMDIGIGRIPARTIEEARGVVAKIKHYESPETQGRWRTRYTFVADDEYPTTRGDGDLHTQNADVVAEDVSARFPEMKIDKVYAISYPAESTPNGQQQVPEATRAVVRLIDEQGSLLWNYSGHGGYAGLADEDLLTLEDIELLNNFDKLTTFVTATCSFGKFDMNRRQSGAEALLLKSDGGAVALMTTVRLVVTSPSTQLYNLGLNLELNQHLFTRDEQGLPRRLGDVMRITKNSNRGLQGNNRKFNLLGDPTMRLGLPRQSVDVTRVGGIDVNARTAPLQALGRVEIEGEVRGFDGMLDVGYNGVAELSVFDAAREVPVEVDGGGRTTLPGNAYDVQNDLIYQGKVRVEAGRFKTSFVVPKDISYRNRAGRVAVYVQSEERGIDGFGATANVIVGGTSDNPVQDADGPDVNLYLNDDPGFVSGSLTTPEPTLVVDLNDDTGLNTTGTG